MIPIAYRVSKSLWKKCIAHGVQEEAEQHQKQEAEHATQDLALEEMKAATAKGLGFDMDKEMPLAHKVARAKAIDQKEELCKLSEALAVLSSASVSGRGCGLKALIGS